MMAEMMMMAQVVAMMVALVAAMTVVLVVAMMVAALEKEALAALENEVLAEETMMVALAVAAMMEVLEGFIRVILLV